MTDGANGKECVDCERFLPAIDFPFSGGVRIRRCRICAGLHDRQHEPRYVVREIYSDVTFQPKGSLKCSKCERAKRPSNSYCNPCMAAYMRERRALHKAKCAAKQMIKHRPMRGVDIDRIHRTWKNRKRHGDSRS